jgi:hypothetical protein
MKYTRKIHVQVMPKLATLTLLGQAQVRSVEIRTLQQIRALVPVSKSVNACHGRCTMSSLHTWHQLRYVFHDG